MEDDREYVGEWKHVEPVEWKTGWLDPKILVDAIDSDEVYSVDGVSGLGDEGWKSKRLDNEVTGFTERMRTAGFDPHHPVMLYNDGGGWEIADGHHRLIAAFDAGLDRVMVYASHEYSDVSKFAAIGWWAPESYA